MAVRQKPRLAGRHDTDARCQIRPARPDDLPGLVALERSAFSDPWSHSDFVEGLSAGWSVFIADGGAGPVGYVVGRTVLDEGEILNLGVSLQRRRLGIGRALVRHLLDEFVAAGVRSVFLEVRESNFPAQQLYHTFGFQEVGRRRRYYHHPVEDAVVLRAVISADCQPA